MATARGSIRAARAGIRAKGGGTQLESTKAGEQRLSWAERIWPRYAAVPRTRARTHFGSPFIFAGHIFAGASAIGPRRNAYRTGTPHRIPSSPQHATYASFHCLLLLSIIVTHSLPIASHTPEYSIDAQGLRHRLA